MIQINKNLLAHEGSTKKFQFEKEGVQLSGFVIFFEGQYAAYINQCRHMPIELDYQPNEFMDEGKQWIICATHGAIYHPISGECISGPCHGQFLQKLNITEKNDVLSIEI